MMASLLPRGLGVNVTSTTLLVHPANIPTSLALCISILRNPSRLWLITALAALAYFLKREH